MSTDFDHARMQGARVFESREQRRQVREQERRQVDEEFDREQRRRQMEADAIFESAQRALVPSPWERLKRLFRR